MPLAVARESSVRLIDEAVASGRMIAVFAQREAAEDDPQQKDLHPVGTASHIHKMFKLPDGSLRIIVQGVTRVRLDEVTTTRPYLKARVTEMPEVVGDKDKLEIDALQRNIKTNFQQIVSLSPLMSDDLQTLAIEHHRARAAGGLHRLQPQHHRHRHQAGGARHARRARPPRSAEPAADQGTRGARARLEDPVAGAVRGRQEPARLLPARAAQGDPEGTRAKATIRPARSTSCARRSTPPACPRR